jgi:FACT complex subunit (SPT16/CDC68)
VAASWAFHSSLAARTAELRLHPPRADFHVVQDGEANDKVHSFVRIQFHCNPQYDAREANPAAAFIKELTFRSVKSDAAMKFVQVRAHRAVCAVVPKPWPAAPAAAKQPALCCRRAACPLLHPLLPRSMPRGAAARLQAPPQNCHCRYEASRGPTRRLHASARPRVLPCSLLCLLHACCGGHGVLSLAMQSAMAQHTDESAHSAVARRRGEWLRVQEAQALRRQVMVKDREAAERATLVKQEKLQRFSNRQPYRLQDVWIHPPISSKRKLPGNLDAHYNGFRCGLDVHCSGFGWRGAARPATAPSASGSAAGGCDCAWSCCNASAAAMDVAVWTRAWCACVRRYQMQGGEALDITYSNLRHAFFQEAENELITLVHFTLKNPIMAGKKKVSNVQFYTEVMENAAVWPTLLLPHCCCHTAAATLLLLQVIQHASAMAAAPPQHAPHQQADTARRAGSGRPAQRVRPGRVRGGAARPRAAAQNQQRVPPLHEEGAGAVGPELLQPQARVGHSVPVRSAGVVVRGANAPPVRSAGVVVHGTNAPPVRSAGVVVRSANAPPVRSAGVVVHGTNAPPVRSAGVVVRSANAPPVRSAGVVVRSANAPPVRSAGVVVRSANAPPVAPRTVRMHAAHVRASLCATRVLPCGTAPSPAPVPADRAGPLPVLFWGVAQSPVAPSTVSGP